MRLQICSLLVFMAIATGCAESRVKPVEPSLAVKNWTPEEILEVVSQRASAVRQVKTLLTVKLEGKRPSGFFFPGRSMDAALWTERPQQIRLQGFSPFGGTLFDLVSKDGRVQLSVPGRSKEIQNSLEEMLIRKGDFSSELLDAIAGGGQTLMRPSELSAIEQNGNEIILYQFLSNKSRLLRKYWLDPDRLLTKQAVYFDPSGRPSVTLLYRDYQSVPSSGGNTTPPEGSFWPREITAILNNKGRLVITFNEVNLNQPFQPGAFTLGSHSQ